MIGVIAQLGERLNGIQEVGGSIPLNSTNRRFQGFSNLVKKSFSKPKFRAFTTF